MKKYRKSIVIVSLFILLPNMNAQVVYQDIEKTSVYEFLDEMANQHIIQINSIVKPYSRQFIANCLLDVQSADSLLNKRQHAELNFFLRDFKKELHSGKYDRKRFDAFYYSDSLFTFSLNGIFGGEIWNNSNGINYHRWYGAEAFAYAGEHLGVYASLRDNAEKTPMSDTGIVTTRNGGVYRAGDYSEMRGGITYSWDWGHVALVKDYVEWGISYRYPNIISSKPPSFAQFKWQIKPVDWFEFNYMHGWLVSELMDSSRSYTYNGVERGVFRNKFIASNMFTFMPLHGKLGISVGNSVIYTDQQINPAYFIPVFFYKSVDHTYNSATNMFGQNSNMFLGISSRLIKKTHMYYSMFIDVMSFSTVWDKEAHVNHWSMIWGIRYSDILPNLTMTLEYVRNNALVYKNDAIFFYGSNNYSLGHYIGDNAREIYAELNFRPIAKLNLTGWYSLVQKGPEYNYTRDANVKGVDFLESVEWEQEQLGFKASFELLNDWHFFITAEKQNLSGDIQHYTSKYYRDVDLTYSFGMNFGF